MTTESANLAACRDCQHAVSLSAPACPHCGAPAPANAEWSGSGYEYKSSATLLGLPLVHVAFGRDRHNRRRVATGIVAIGQFGRGVITIAQFGVGAVFVGQFGVGMLALGQFAAGACVAAQFAAGLYVLGQFGLALIHGHAAVLFP